MLKHVFAAVIGLLVVIGGPAMAQQELEDILRSLTFRTGTISLGNDLATITQTKNFRFLDSADTETFLTEVWGNPPGTGKGTLGMIFPADGGLADDDAWGVVVSYETTGHISDEEAGTIDYDQLMADMKAAVVEESKKRVKQGQEQFSLLGWARKPHYDATEKKLYWAKRYRFGDDPEETLNYEIRVLGRKGVLSLNVISSMRELPTIDSKVNSILSMVRFNKGNTYAEYDSSVDHTAAYGIAGLIAGGVLGKAGFFKGLIALLLASKKLFGLALFGGLAGLWSWMKSLLRRRKGVSLEKD